MFKKITCFILTAFMLFSFAGCGNPQQEAQVSEDLSSVLSITPPPSSEESSEPQMAINPLTGLDDLDPSVVSNRPVAVMVNNLAVAQGVQTGLNDADIVYETLVEGGITRYMAVYKDISKLSNIGTVRSARYVYVDLALGHDALYVHAGMDPIYCEPHMEQTGIDDIDLNSGAAANYSMRLSNGLATEHTLYTSGSKLVSAISGLSRRNTTTKTEWLNFGDPDATQKPSAGNCNILSVPMSSSYVSGFTYDATTGNYLKTQNGHPQKDYRTGEQLEFRNIFVLLTTTSLYPDGYHCKVNLTSGTGYYVSAGGYELVRWSKGSASAPLKITKSDGTELTVNAGKSWICIADLKTNVLINE